MTATSDDRRHSARGARTNLGTLAGQASFFAFGAVAARLFGDAAWGVYTTAYAWIDVLVRGSLLATDKAVLVLVPAHRARGDEAAAERAVGNALRIAFVASMLGALVMMIVSFGVGVRDARDGDAMRRLAPVVVLSSVGLLLLAATMAARVLSHNFYAKGLAEPLVTFAAALALGALWPELGGLALAPLIAACIVVAIAWRGVRALYNARAVVAHARRGPLDPELVRFALPLAASEFLNILAMRLGSFVLIAYAGPIDRAVFNTALLLAGTISYLRGLFDTVLGPLAAEAWAAGQPERVAANLKAQTRSVLVFAAPYASLFIVAGDALLALYGDGFVAGHRAMIWLAVGHIINATLGLTGWVLMAAHRTRAMLVNNVAKIALEIALCVALIPYLGIEGAALATCAAIAVLQSLQVYEVYRLAGIHPFSRGLLWCALGGAAMIVAELAVVHALESQLTRQVLAPIVVVVGGGAYIATILLSSRRTRA